MCFGNKCLGSLIIVRIKTLQISSTLFENQTLYLHFIETSILKCLYLYAYILMSLNKGNFFSFIMYKESYLKIFEYFILNVHLIAPISPPIFVYWIMRQNTHFTVPLPYTMLCCLCNVCCYCTRLLSYSCCFITKFSPSLNVVAAALGAIIVVVWCCCCHWFLSCSHLYSCRIWLSLLLFIALVSATVIAFVTGLNVACIY